MTQSDQNTTVPAYPLVSFGSALEVARAVSEAGGAKSSVQKALIASQLGSSDTSGAFLQRLSSARSYRMIDGRGSYKLTPSAVAYFLPANSDDPKRALLSFLASPPVFGEIIKRYDGTKLASVDMLANIVHREMNVSESWKDRVASFFIKAAHTAAAVDSQGFLRYRASLQRMESQPQSESIEPAPEPGNQPPLPRGAEGMDALIFTRDGKTVRLETSPDLPLALWQRLDSYVTGLKPSKGDKAK